MQWKIGNSGTLHPYYYPPAVLQIQYSSDFHSINNLKVADNELMRGPVHVIRHPAPAGVDPAVHQSILTAIHEKKLLQFFYHDKIRIVEPQDYGIQKGAVQLFTYQIAGESGSSSLPDWRKFVVKNISSLELLEKPFAGSRAVPSQRHQEWDVLFARVE